MRVELGAAAPLDLGRHRLALQRIHARQPTDAALVELDRLALLLVRRGEAQELLTPRLQALLDRGEIELRQLGHREIHNTVRTSDVSPFAQGASRARAAGSGAGVVPSDGARPSASAAP